MTQTYTSVFGNQAIPDADNSFSSIALTVDTQFYWPEIATGPYLLFDIMEMTSTASVSMILPEANKASVGKSISVRNVGSYLITIKRFDNVVVGTLNPGETKNIYISSNTTPAGEWGIVGLGTGVSSPDAGVLAGNGLRATASKLNQESYVISASTDLTINVSHLASTIMFSAIGAVSCNLLDSALASNGFFLNVTNQGSGQVTIETYAAQKIDGEDTKVLVPGESATLVCNGVNWVTVGYGRSTQFQFTKLVFDISSSTPFTLTSTQAQNKLIEFIGTLTAPAVVNLPAVVAIYYVQCSYNGAFSVTLKTAGGVGVELQPGERYIMYCDGVDVVMAQTVAVPTVNISGGVAGAVVYQAAEDITSFTGSGTVGDVLVSGGTGAPTWENPDETFVLKTSLTGSAKLPTGTTAQRDTTPTFGMVRGNETTQDLEYWASGWHPFKAVAVSHEETYTAVEGQTVFPLSSAYPVGVFSLTVEINGLSQEETAYVETDSMTVTFTEGLATGDVVTFRWNTAEVLTTANAANVTYNPAGIGAVTTTVQSKLREIVSIKDFGAVEGKDATEAINKAITAIGTSGGIVYFPPGTYLLSNSNPGAVSWDNKVAIWVKHSNVHLVGAGVGATKLILADGADCTVVKFGQREETVITVHHCSLRGIEIDGNRLNQTQPTVSDYHWSGVDISSDCTYIVVDDFYIHDTQYYGVGLERQNNHNCRLSNGVIENTGADGIDCKDDTALLRNVVIENIRVSNFGLSEALSAQTQAGINVRGGCVVKSCESEGFVGIHSGFRVDGALAGLNEVPSILMCCRALAGARDTTNGFHVTSSVNSFHTVLTDCFAEGANVGFYMPTELSQITGCYASDCYTGFDISNNSQVLNAKARLCNIGYRSRGNNSIFTNIRSTNNTVGLQVESGATLNRFDGGYFASNTTNVTDVGTQTAISGIVGVRTHSVGKTAVPIDSIGTKAVVIAHGLDFTPLLDNVVLSYQRNTNVGDFSLGFDWVYNADSTNVYCNVRVLTASATPGATIYLVADCVAAKATRQ